MAVLASVALVGILVAGCDSDSPDPVAPPTSRSGGSEGATTSTLPAPGHFVGGWAVEKDIWGLTSEPCPRPDNGSKLLIVAGFGLALFFFCVAAWAWYHRSSRYLPA